MFRAFLEIDKKQKLIRERNTRGKDIRCSVGLQDVRISKKKTRHTCRASMGISYF